MANRQPIGASEILDKTLTAGKNSPAIVIGSTPANPNEGFGFNVGTFHTSFPLTLAALTKSTTVDYALRVVDAYFVVDGSLGAGQQITVRKTSAGVTTTLITLTTAGIANEIIRATTITSNYTTLALAAGDTLSIVSSALNAPVYVFVSAMNI